MMLTGARLLLLVDPTAVRRWRGPLRATAQAAGLQVVETPAPEFFDVNEPVLVLSDDGNWSVHIDARRAHVFFGGVRLALPVGEVSFQDRHELYKASRELVLGANMIAKGAAYSDETCAGAFIEGLGKVFADDNSEALASRHSPLDLYKNFPPPVGAAADWPARLFSYQPEAFFDGSSRIDLTGRARVLVHGPYLFLPAGRWRATIGFVAEPGLKPIPLTFRWGHEGNFEALETVIETAGAYELVLDRDWHGPGAAQVVVTLDRPIFEGMFTFGGCRVEKISEVTQPPVAD